MTEEEKQLAQYMETALGIVKDAGSQVTEAYNRQRDGMEAQNKGREELYKELSKRVEEQIKAKLEFHFPTHEVLGREAGAATKVDWDEDAITWFLDPLDGRYNFIHRMPLLSICLALVHQRKTLVGIVYNPVTGDLYTGSPGRGAYKNGFRLKTSRQTRLDKSLVMTSGGKDAVLCSPGALEKGKPADIGEVYIHNLNCMWEAGVHGIRWLDAAALAICAVAEGASDIFVDYGLNCWSLAAAVLILAEAGGAVQDPEDGPFQLMSRRVIGAASPELLNVYKALPFRHCAFPLQTTA